jgi:hypothetical protein
VRCYAVKPVLLRFRFERLALRQTVGSVLWTLDLLYTFIHLPISRTTMLYTGGGRVRSLREELKTVGKYIRAVGKHWMVIVIGLGLTGVDFVERMFGTWFVFPLWLRLAVGIAGLIVAQYLAYRDFVKAKYERLTDEQMNTKIENDSLRYGVAQLEEEIKRLTAENTKLKIKPYDQVQRHTVQSKLKTYSDVERDLLRFLLQRGETVGALIYQHSQVGDAQCTQALEKLTREGLLMVRTDMSQPLIEQPRFWRINPIFEPVLNDLLFPREEAHATSRFMV